MPYRDAVESVVQRCMDLRARLQRIERRRVAPRECSTLDEAVAWQPEERTYSIFRVLVVAVLTVAAVVGLLRFR